MGGASGTRPAAEALLPLDWNGDYRMDLAIVGAGGFSLLTRNEDGELEQNTPRPVDGIDMGSLVGYGAWAADIEMDGDLDIVHGPLDEAPWVLRNNADNTFAAARPFPAVAGLRGFGWGRPGRRRGSGRGTAGRGRRRASAGEPAGRPVRVVAGVGGRRSRWSP